jgi:hypothetical protein
MATIFVVERWRVVYIVSRGIAKGLIEAALTALQRPIRSVRSSLGLADRVDDHQYPFVFVISATLQILDSLLILHHYT